MADDDGDPNADVEYLTRLKKGFGGDPRSNPIAPYIDEELPQAQARAKLYNNTGCLIAGFLAVLVVGALVTLGLLNRDDGCKSGAPRRDGLVLIACQPADATSSSTDASSSSADTSSSSSSSSSSAGTAGGGAAAIAPPDASSLPKGAILLQGQTGDEIGPIAQDGKNRFVSLTGPGVTTDGNSVAVAWDKGAGKVVSFGSNLHTGTNKGRYGFALFRNVPATPPTTSPTGEADSQYRAGCAIEVGATSCKSDTAGAPIVNGDRVTIIIGEAESQYRAGCAIEVGTTSCKSDREGAPIVDGDRVTIIIGEAGTGVGDYSADWWFVFQPD